MDVSCLFEIHVRDRSYQFLKWKFALKLPYLSLKEFNVFSSIHNKYPNFSGNMQNYTISTVKKS